MLLLLLHPYTFLLLPKTINNFHLQSHQRYLFFNPPHFICHHQLFSFLLYSKSDSILSKSNCENICSPFSLFRSRTWNNCQTATPPRECLSGWPTTTTAAAAAATERPAAASEAVLAELFRSNDGRGRLSRHLSATVGHREPSGLLPRTRREESTRANPSEKPRGIHEEPRSDQLDRSS